MNKGMKQHVMRAAACFMVGSMTFAGSGMAAMAAGTSLVGLGTSQTAESSEASQDIEEEAAEEESGQDAGEEPAAQEQSLVNTIAIAQPGDDSYVNIRSNPDQESDLVGKLYNNNAATILGEDGDWYYVQSGNCVGYVAKYLLVTGSEAADIASNVGTPVAMVNASALMVRSDASEDAEVVDMVSENQVVYLEEDLGGWAKVSTDNTTGYVSADYVSYATYLPQAESVEEEAARIAQEEAEYAAWVAQQEAEYAAWVAQQEAEYEAYLAQQQAEWDAQNQAWIEYLQSQGEYADQAQAAADQAYADQAYAEQVAAEAQAAADQAYASGDEAAAAEAQAAADQAAAEAAAQAEAAAAAAAEAQAADQAAVDAASQALENAGVDTSDLSSDGTSSTRQSIVDYALQFVGNPYVWGGTSLTNGADCSGFTQSVMADNGISINRTAGQQSQGGTAVDLSNIQPGDLLFYEGSGDYGIGHVSMYIGNGQVVHASNSTDGIIVSDINYRTPVSARSYISD